MCSNNDGHSILDELNDDGGVENTRNTAIKEDCNGNGNADVAGKCLLRFLRFVYVLLKCRCHQFSKCQCRKWQ